MFKGAITTLGGSLSDATLHPGHFNEINAGSPGSRGMHGLLGINGGLIKMGVSINAGTPKWMVYNGKSCFPSQPRSIDW